MFKQFTEEVKDFENRMKFKINEIKYSPEYLDLKDDLNEAGKHLKSASKNVGKISKKIFSKDRFVQMMNAKA